MGRDLPVLSHLALRARQLGTVFACTAEQSLFDAMARAAEGSAVRLSVDASGATRLEPCGAGELGAVAAAAAAKPRLGALNLSGQQVVEAVTLAEQPDVAGAKAASSGKLEKLAQQLGFKARDVDGSFQRFFKELKASHGLF